jgi:hypothetical protein
MNAQTSAHSAGHDEVSAPQAPPLTRDELYERVWAEPVYKIAARYGWSGRGLGKHCAELLIPVPPRGYWARRQAGQRVRQPGLPTLPPGRRGATGIVLRPAVLLPETQRRSHTPVVAAQEAVERVPAQRVVVAASLDAATPWHPLIATQLSGRKTRPKNDFGRAADALSPDIRVSEAVQSRAFLLLDALFKALEARGYPVASRMPRPHFTSNGAMHASTDWPSRWHGHVTCVAVGEQDVLLTLRELQKQVKPAPPPPEPPARRGRRSLAEDVLRAGGGVVPYTPQPRRELVPSGRLALSIPHHVGCWGAFRSWEDPRADARGPQLEECLNEVIVGIVEAAEEYRSVTSRWRADLEARRQAAVREAEDGLRRAAAAARIDALVRDATAWRQAEDIRAYIAAFAAETALPDAERAEYVAWALEQADQCDPLRRALTPGRRG